MKTRNQWKARENDAWTFRFDSSLVEKISSLISLVKACLRDQRCQTLARKLCLGKDLRFLDAAKLYYGMCFSSYPTPSVSRYSLFLIVHVADWNSRMVRCCGWKSKPIRPWELVWSPFSLGKACPLTTWLHIWWAQRQLRILFFGWLISTSSIQKLLILARDFSRTSGHEVSRYLKLSGLLLNYCFALFLWSGGMWSAVGPWYLGSDYRA